MKASDAPGEPCVRVEAFERGPQRPIQPRRYFARGLLLAR